MLQNTQNEKLIKPINKNELKEAIDQMENDKSPGIDGIPIESYKIFYDKIEKDLLQIYINILFTEKKTYKNYELGNNYINNKKRKIKPIKILETNLLALSGL